MYAESINYRHAPPPPPLSDTQAKWLDEFLRAQGAK